MIWRVVVTTRAQRNLRRVDSNLRTRLLRAVRRLATTGIGDVQRVRGQGGVLRLRVGAWRVFFLYQPQDRTLQVVEVQHRREAYRRL